MFFLGERIVKTFDLILKTNGAYIRHRFFDLLVRHAVAHASVDLVKCFPAQFRERQAFGSLFRAPQRRRPHADRHQAICVDAVGWQPWQKRVREAIAVRTAVLRQTCVAAYLSTRVEL